MNTCVNRCTCLYNLLCFTIRPYTVSSSLLCHWMCIYTGCVFTFHQSFLVFVQNMLTNTANNSYLSGNYVCLVLFPSTLVILIKGLYRSLAFISPPVAKTACETRNRLKNYVHSLTSRLPEPVWIGSPFETGYHRKFINGPKSQQLT